MNHWLIMWRCQLIVESWVTMIWGRDTHKEVMSRGRASEALLQVKSPSVEHECRQITRDPSTEPHCSNTYRLNKDKEATRQIWERPVSKKSKVDWLSGNRAALLSKRRKWLTEFSKAKLWEVTIGLGNMVVTKVLTRMSLVPMWGRT